MVCSLNEINTKFKPIIGSLYSDSYFIISFVSSVNEELKLKIEYIQDFYERYFSQNITKESILIKIKIPENKEKEEKDVEIKGNLKFISNNYSELNLPYSLSFKILPLQILFSCKDYLIAFQDGNYYLCLDKIISNSSLHFSAKYFNLKGNVVQKVNLISLEENKAPFPLLKNDNSENIELKIIGTEKPVRFQCIVNFAFSKKLIIPLNIDTIIIPFDFAFEIYDFSIKKFSKSTNVIFSDKNRELNFEPITLKFKIYLPNLYNNQNFTGKISYSTIPTFVDILNSKEIKDKEFQIANEFIFEIKIQINKKTYSSKKDLIIYASINGSPKQNVTITFIHNILNKKNYEYEEGLVKNHDKIYYSPFDYLNYIEERYQQYKNIYNPYKEKYNIFGFPGTDFYSITSNNYSRFGFGYTNFDQFLRYNNIEGSLSFIIM